MTKESTRQRAFVETPAAARDSIEIGLTQVQGRTRTSEFARADEFEALLHEAARISEPPEPSTSLAVGSSLARGRLRVVRPLGHGGMGAVYEVYDAVRGERVALKLLTRAHAVDVYQLKNEFRALACVEHPNVVRLYELFAEDGRWFFTMELVRGEPFDRWVRSEDSAQLDRLRAATGQLVDALAAIHAFGKLHRDLKPANVLVESGGRLVVLDLGLAVDAEAGGVGSTISERLVSGTPAYMAPEQAAGRAATRASDFYAVGVMLFEAATGQLPFVGAAHAVLAAKQDEPAPPPHRLCPGVCPDLDAVCIALLSRDPAERLAAAALRARLHLPESHPTTATRAPETCEHADLCGRESELAALAEALSAALCGRPSLVVVRGESGIGKTALCASFARAAAAEHGAVVLMGRCFERESVPYKAIDPVVDALTRYLRQLEDADAASLLPRDVAAISRLFPAFARSDVIRRAPVRAFADPAELRCAAFSALGELLARIRDRRPVVLHCDDLQWTDDESLSCLHHLIIQRPAAPLLVVLSERGEVGDPHGKAHTLLAAATSSPDWQVRTMELGALPAAAAVELAARVLPSSTADAARDIAREARCHPFFVHELCLQAHAGDRAARGGSMAAMIGRRVEALTACARRLLEIVALAGQPVAVAAALQAADATLAALDVLEAERLVRGAPRADASGGRRVECYHDRVREAVEALLSHDERRQRWIQIAEALRRQPHERDAGLLCRSLEEAGKPIEASRAAARAAEQAGAQMAFERAAALYRKALALGTHAREEALALTESLGDVLSHCGRGVEAAAAYEQAAVMAGDARRTELERRCAQELFVAGQMDAGRARLAKVCRATELSLPVGDATALRLASIGLAKLQVRALHTKHARPLSAHECLRLEVASTTVWAFRDDVSPLRQLAAAAQYLTLALDAGQPMHLVQALAAAVATYGNIWPTGRWTHTLLQAMDDVAAQAADPMMLGLASGVHGLMLFHRGLHRRSRARLAVGLAELQHSGHTALLDAARCYDQINACNLGDYADLVNTTPVLIAEAEQRGRTMPAAFLSGAYGAPAFLTVDQPTTYERLLESARRHVPRDATASIQDHFLLGGEVTLAMYVGEPERMWTSLDARLQNVERSARRRALNAYDPTVHASRASCAAAILGRRREAGANLRRTSWFVAATRSIEVLRRSRWPHIVALAEMLEATLQVQAGEPERGIASLRRALRMQEDADALMHAAATRRRLGQAIGGDEGKRMVADSARFMAMQGVRNVEAITETLCPGL